MTSTCTPIHFWLDSSGNWELHGCMQIACTAAIKTITFVLVSRRFRTDLGNDVEFVLTELSTETDSGSNTAWSANFVCLLLSLFRCASNSCHSALPWHQRAPEHRLRNPALFQLSLWASWIYPRRHPRPLNGQVTYPPRPIQTLTAAVVPETVVR